MTEKLLPCPFCGGNEHQIDEMESFWDKNETSWRVLCIDCIAETAGDTKEQAIAAWNRRADVAPVVRGEWLVTDAYPHRVYCSVCYKTNVLNEEWLFEKNEYPHFCMWCGAKMEVEP